MESLPMFMDSPIKSVKNVAVRQLFPSTQSNASIIDSEANGN